KRCRKYNGTKNGSYAKFVVNTSKSIRRESSFSLIRKMKRGGTHYSIQCGFCIAPWHWLAIDPSSSDASPATRTCSEEHELAGFLSCLPDLFAASSQVLHAYHRRLVLGREAGAARTSC